MSDNTRLTASGGAVFASDEIDDIHFQRVKMTLGGDGDNDGDVSAVNPMPIHEMSITILSGGQSEEVSISAISAKSDVINTDKVTVISDVDCYVRQGEDPTALADGSDQPIPAGMLLRCVGITPGNKLAFITKGDSGTISITPGA